MSTLHDLVPLITGAGGALVVLMVGVWLLLTERLVPGTAHRRALALVTKLEGANDELQRTVAAERDQKQQLLSSGGVSNQLASAIVELARGRATMGIVPAAQAGQSAAGSG